MFGQNQITGAKFFKDADDKLLVTSIFLTLQGEGPYQGQPAIFVRLTHCNLDCSFCDTWFDSGDWFSITDLVQKVVDLSNSKYLSFDDVGIVVTGGEPGLQPNIAEFLLRCQVLGFKFTQIESNGIIPINRLPTKTTVVISPKCSEKTDRYLEPHAESLNSASCLKFIVSADEGSPYHTIPDWALEWRAETGRPIYVSPMNKYRASALKAAIDRIKERKEHGIDYRSTVDEVVDGWDDTILDREENRLNHAYAAEYALSKGLYLTLQMQLYAKIA